MNAEEFFKNNHIDTIEKAKTAYIMCGCNKFHMWHDYTDKLKEYDALGISREQELEWTKEQFLIEIEKVRQIQNNGETWWHLYNKLINKMCSLKEKDLFYLALDVTNDLSEKTIDINHYHILAFIIGHNKSQTHGGFIEKAMKNGYLDIGQKVYSIAEELIQKVYPILSEKQKKYLNWLCNNMQDEIAVWPELSKDYRQTVVNKLVKN